LTVKGPKQAKRMAAWLKDLPSGRYQILASPTACTRLTAMTLTVDYDVLEDIGPAVTARGIVRAAGWPDGKAAVIVVGHRSGMNRAAALLITGREREWGKNRVVCSGSSCAMRANRHSCAPQRAPRMPEGLSAKTAGSSALI